MASANKVKYGLKSCYMATFEIDSVTGAYTYGTPFAVPGAVSLSLSAEGDSNDFYADNVIYFNSTANQGYSGDLTLAMIPDDVRTQILGETIDANGALIENSTDRAKGFAFGFQIEGDKKNRRFWYYNCSLTRPTTESNTIEATITPQTDTLTIKAMPRLTDNAVRAFMEESETNTQAYNDFFTQVYEAVETI